MMAATPPPLSISNPAPSMTTTWINPNIPPDPRIRSVGVTEEEIIARLHDGRRISIPLAWSEKLAAATRDQRRNFQILDDGELIYWPEADEFLSAQGMLYGTKARIIRREP